ncbi:hypothetical protein like AT3G24535 [Hibiscus trionum]|uniref:OVATE domain-containing protein n=1 Tax=Hibiscus trionum TaxID=183268 RepID=A0A9W7MQ29_HIBTR|nr:hypothetical protein like AT3G24535 [Hibiscus trionum]
MLFRNPIPNTKRFFQRTLRSFKSLFIGTEAQLYHKLPKTSPYDPYPFATAAGVDMNRQTSPRDPEKLYTHFIDNRNNNNKTIVSSPRGEGPREGSKGERREIGSNSSERRRESRSSMVAQRLKELEMMDMSNAEHVRDIQEVLHYYSRLTCPTYLDIVDKFFMEMYAEIFGHFDSPSFKSGTKYHRSVRY